MGGGGGGMSSGKPFFKASLKVNFFITFYFLVRNICHIQEARRTVVMIYLSLKKHKSLGHHYYIFSSVASLDYYMSV